MEQVSKASQILNSGGIVIFPTETVFGIGCLLDQEEAIVRLYKLKKRDPNKPIAVLVSSLDQAKGLVSFNDRANTLAKKYWPGPLTLCLKAAKDVPKAILGIDGTLGIRVSSNSFIKSLQAKLRTPLLAPSANFQGSQPPRTLVEIDKSLVSLVDYVVDIPPDGDLPSTVVTFENSSYQIVREGGVTRVEIEQTLKSKE